MGVYGSPPCWILMTFGTLIKDFWRICLSVVIFFSLNPWVISIWTHALSLKAVILDFLPFWIFKKTSFCELVLGQWWYRHQIWTQEPVQRDSRNTFPILPLAGTIIEKVLFVITFHIFGINHYCCLTSCLFRFWILDMLSFPVLQWYSKAKPANRKWCISISCVFFVFVFLYLSQT